MGLCRERRPVFLHAEWVLRAGPQPANDQPSIATCSDFLAMTPCRVPDDSGFERVRIAKALDTRVDVRKGWDPRSHRLDRKRE